MGTDVEGRALVSQQPAPEHTVILECIRDEVDSVHMAIFKIHLVHLVTLRPVNDATELCPYRRRATHPTGL